MRCYNHDVLWLLRFWCCDIFQYKLLKFVIFVMLVANTVLMVLQGYHFLINFNSLYFISYSPYWFGSFFIILSLTTCLTISNIGPEGIKSATLWQIKSTDPKLINRIKFQVKLITAYIIVNTVIALIAGLAHTFPSKNAEEICYVYKIIEIYVPKWKTELCWMYKASYIVMALALPATCNQVVYGATHIRFQFYLVLDWIRNNIIESGCDDLKLPNDKDFQHKITKNIIVIVKRYTEFHRTFQAVNQRIAIYILLYAVIGGLLGISILMFYFKFSDTLVISDYLHAGTLTVAAITTFMATVTSGQKLEDIFEELLYTWCSVPWYLFNKWNKQIYLMIMVNIKPINFRFTENSSVNYNLGAAIAKTIYSMLSLLTQMSDKDVSTL
ncbi:odorant receptor 304 [Tribolium castaneum]|uniref:Odorant receptor n=1 Tax=Tribolium castaneum TaxID=7070 RepID=D2EE65_TRICA|nr:odorant receptor 304 [Tribolium castaneum]